MRIAPTVAMALAMWLPMAALADPVANQVFGAQAAPSAGAAAAHGSYAKGCIAGAVELPETGPGWQAMRLSRNRNWGHPAAISFVQRLAGRAREVGWNGLYIGDISQPRGGPMLSGHRSHQIGLDIDIWLRPAGAAPLSRAEREKVGSASVVAADRKRVLNTWTPEHHLMVKAAASDPAVARIFVNAAIKQRMCRDAGPDDRAWLRKIRPWWGHDAHFHVRLDCPSGAAGCTPQAPPAPGDGCDESLAWWFSDEALNPKPDPNKKPAPPLTLSALPQACQALVSGG